MSAHCRDAAAAFPLFDLPDEAVELVLSLVGDPEDKRALRLVCKRSRASVDSRVVAVLYWALKPGAEDEPEDEDDLGALVRAPWLLQDLKFICSSLFDAGAASLAAAHWPGLQELWLESKNLGAAGAAALAAATWPALKKLVLSDSSLGNAGAASLAAAHWPALQVLLLDSNSLGDAGPSSRFNITTKSYQLAHPLKQDCGPSSSTKPIN